MSKKFDGGDDTWLQMKGAPKEWAVAFHGVSSPNYVIENGKTVFNSIMEGMQTDCMLKVGARQAYATRQSLNRPNETVGRGVYFSPHIQIPFQSYSSRTDKYSLIFQCRVNPK